MEAGSLAKKTGELFAAAFHEWKEDDAMQWGAALAFYATLALAPLLVTLVAVAGTFMDDASVRAAVLGWVGDYAGDAGRTVARAVLTSGDDGSSGMLAGIASGLFLLIGATSFFGQLQKALDELWDVEMIDGGWRRILRTRLLGFAMVLGIGVFMLATLVLQAILRAIPGPGLLVTLLSPLASVAVFTLLFAAVYKVVPDVDIRWLDVWVGAAATAALFTIGQILIGLYFAHSSVGSRYGALGSLVALLIWLYYSTLVFFFGAEFTQVWARTHGRRIEPVAGARRVRTVTLEADAVSGAAGDAASAPSRGKAVDDAADHDAVRREASHR